VTGGDGRAQEVDMVCTETGGKKEKFRKIRRVEKIDGWRDDGHTVLTKLLVCLLGDKERKMIKHAYTRKG